jgi:hypothetical protein
VSTTLGKRLTKYFYKCSALDHREAEEFVALHYDFRDEERKRFACCCAAKVGGVQKVV